MNNTNRRFRLSFAGFEFGTCFFLGLLVWVMGMDSNSDLNPDPNPKTQKNQAPNPNPKTQRNQVTNPNQNPKTQKYLGLKKNPKKHIH
jgi:hypothetical protein